MGRYVVVARLKDNRNFYITFSKQEILDCLYSFPSDRGLEVLLEWPLDREVEVEFFLELVNKNVLYYFIKDRETERKECIHFSSL